MPAMLPAKRLNDKSGLRRSDRMNLQDGGRFPSNWHVDSSFDDNSKPVICGGSCLCPPEYINPKSKFEFKTQACDVGFRIVTREYSVPVNF